MYHVRSSNYSDPWPCSEAVWMSLLGALWMEPASS